jgi:hypothetical protein
VKPEILNTINKIQEMIECKSEHKDIAKAVGMELNTFKGFIIAYKHVTGFKRIDKCLYCDTEFKTSKSKQVYCKPECRNQARKLKLKVTPPTVVCALTNCDNVFIRNIRATKRHKFCSIKCQRKSYGRGYKTFRLCINCGVRFKINSHNHYKCTKNCKDLTTLVCKLNTCAKQFKTYDKRVSYCSKLCRIEKQRLDAMRPQQRSVICKFCGKRFTVDRMSRTKYCGKECISLRLKWKRAGDNDELRRNIRGGRTRSYSRTSFETSIPIQPQNLEKMSD